MTNWEEEEKAEKEFWLKMGENLGYADKECPKCGRVRVEKWGCGLEICEKCHYDLVNEEYFRDKRFCY